MTDNQHLNEREQAILDYIKDRIRNVGYPPSVREIGRAVGLKSSSTVHSYLIQLEEKGFIRKDPAKPRAIIPVDNDMSVAEEALRLPVVGQVAAGTPILAEQNIDTYLPVPQDLVGSGNHFILRVKGESMIEAGIMDGDYLIVRQQSDASNGEIIVALLDDDATVKRYYLRDGYVELKPENSSMEPIIAPHIQIVGKVTGLMRKIS
ncbi:transcriptional repressor LexA [Syntrophomonas erecta]